MFEFIVGILFGFIVRQIAVAYLDCGASRPFRYASMSEIVDRAKKHMIGDQFAPIDALLTRADDIKMWNAAAYGYYNNIFRTRFGLDLSMFTGQTNPSIMSGSSAAAAGGSSTAVAGSAAGRYDDDADPDTSRASSAQSGS